MNQAPTLPQESALRIDKQRVADTFGKAARTYDAAATLQQRVAARARLGLPELGDHAAILDMGCGTGKETIALRNRYPDADITGLDLSDGMLAYARDRKELDGCHWIVGDIEELPFEPEDFDLVFSSLAIQWCESLSEVLAQVYRVLKPGGWFVFSTLAEGSLYELEKAWQAVDSKPHVNSYEAFECQKRRVATSEFQTCSLRQQTETLYYPSVMHLLREMKSLGANTVVGSEVSGLSGRRTLKSLSEGYASFSSERGLPASYQVIYGVLRKSAS
ncbi:malonyl-ACP O-methyltransferase BioC [Parendozoicomonas haliclonae]|uniref:Malonyl-[acyl-carrier protein] O-methyltransferase n=1 Tax=Parendozoicomonas haliclonae TaxID=1960125 RepID=A0A1X7AJB9_9GAMM|nr:malonyl-ACP O-methyltransferase BioC [Parendozoicomonas haliclonae]SMA45311.1 Malonyl-[acyl-carrier protein] O-methyltransferase [Parendozoicomonas haliclonae]